MCNKCEYFDNGGLKKMCAECRDRKFKTFDKISAEYEAKGQEVPPYLEPDWNEGWN